MLVKSGRHTIVSTGRGSVLLESFLALCLAIVNVIPLGTIAPRAAVATKAPVALYLQMAPYVSVAQQHLFIRFIVRNESRSTVVLALPNTTYPSFTTVAGVSMPYRPMNDPESCHPTFAHGTGSGDIDLNTLVDNRSGEAMTEHNRVLSPGGTYIFARDLWCRFKPNATGRYDVRSSLSLSIQLPRISPTSGNPEETPLGMISGSTTVTLIP